MGKGNKLPIMQLAHFSSQNKLKDKMYSHLYD